MGSVAACSSAIPSGTGTTDAAGTTMSSACAPPSGRRGATAAITAAPTSRRSTSSPSDSTSPAASMPGTQGGASPSRPRSRRPMSVGLTAAALTASRTSPGPASRTERSTTRTTSRPPGLTIPTALTTAATPILLRRFSTATLPKAGTRLRPDRGSSPLCRGRPGLPPNRTCRRPSHGGRRQTRRR